MPGEKVYRVFLSSTAEDMESHRARVIEELEKLDNVKVIRAFAARGGLTVEECTRLAREADVLVVAVAHRYGWVPSIEEGGDGEHSITWLEVKAAADGGVPIPVFLVDPKHPWTFPKEQDGLLEAETAEEAAEIYRRVQSLRAFRAELERMRPREWFRQPADLAAKVVSAIGNLTRHLSAGGSMPTTGPERIPDMAPPLRPGWIDRPEELAVIKRAVLEATESPISITAKLQGVGGMGKTTLATAVCHDPEIREAFADGVLWASLGQDPDLSSHVVRLCEELTGATRTVGGSRAELGRALAEALNDRRCLLVIDDVWKSEHLEPFTLGAPRCVRLITTRLRHVAPLATHVDVDHMTTDQATELLTRGVDRSGLDEDQLQSVAVAAGRWPLVLEQLAAQVAHRVKEGADAASVLTAVQRRLAHAGTRSAQGPLAAHEDVVGAALSDNIALLLPEQREQYAMLSVFPEDDPVDVATVNRLWRYPDLHDAAELVELMSDLSLVTYDAADGSIRLHDVVRDHLAGRLLDKQAVHRALVSSWGDPCRLTDPFALRNIATHLHGAGDTDALDALVDRPFLEHKTLVTRSRHGFARDAEIARNHALGLDPPHLPMALRCALVHAHLLTEGTRAPLEAIGVLAGVGDVAQARGLIALLGTAADRASAELAIAQRCLERHRVDEAATALRNAIDHARRTDEWSDDHLLLRALRLAATADLSLVHGFVDRPTAERRVEHIAAVALGLLEAGHDSAGAVVDRLEEVLGDWVSTDGDGSVLSWKSGDDLRLVLGALGRAGRTRSLEAVLDHLSPWEIPRVLEVSATILVAAGMNDILLAKAALVDDELGSHRALVAIARAGLDHEQPGLAQSAVARAAAAAADLPSNDGALCMATRAVIVARLDKEHARELLRRARLEVDAADEDYVASCDVDVRLIWDESDDAIISAGEIKNDDRRDGALLRIVDHFARAGQLDRASEVLPSIRGDAWIEAVLTLARGHARHGTPSKASDLSLLVPEEERTRVLASAAAALFERGDDHGASQMVQQALATLGRAAPLTARPAALNALATAARNADARSAAYLLDQLSAKTLDALSEPGDRAEALRQLITMAGDSPAPAHVEALEALVMANADLADDDEISRAHLEGVARTAPERMPQVLEDLREAIAGRDEAINIVHATVAAVNAVPVTAWDPASAARAQEQGVAAARRVSDPVRKVDVLFELALSLGLAGQPQIAREIGEEIESAEEALSADRPEHYVGEDYHVAMAELWAVADDERRALEHVERCVTGVGRDRALAAAASGLARHQPHRAIEMARGITAPYKRQGALQALVVDVARGASPAAARSLIDEIDDAELRARSAVELAGVLLDGDEPDLDTASSLSSGLELDWAVERHLVLLATAQARKGSAAVEHVDRCLVPLDASQKVGAYMEIIDALTADMTVGSTGPEAVELRPEVSAYLDLAEQALDQIDDPMERAWRRVGLLHYVARWSGERTARAAADELPTSELRATALRQVASGLAGRRDHDAVVALAQEVTEALEEAPWADEGVREEQLRLLVAPLALVGADDQVVAILDRLTDEQRIEAFGEATVARHETGGLDAALQLAASLPTRVRSVHRPIEDLLIRAISALAAAGQQSLAGELAADLDRVAGDPGDAWLGSNVAVAYARAGRWDLVLGRVAQAEDRSEALELLIHICEDGLDSAAPIAEITEMSLRLLGEADDPYLWLEDFVSGLAAAGGVAAALDVASAAHVEVGAVVRGAIAAPTLITLESALESPLGELSGRSDPGARVVSRVLRALHGVRPVPELVAALDEPSLAAHRSELASRMATWLAGHPDRSARQQALELARAMPDAVSMEDVAAALLLQGDDLLARLAADEALRDARTPGYHHIHATGVKLRIAASVDDREACRELLDQWSAELEEDDLLDAASRCAEPRLLAELIRRANPQPDELYALVQHIAAPLVQIVGGARAAQLATALVAADGWAGSPTAGVPTSSSSSTSTA